MGVELTEKYFFNLLQYKVKCKNKAKK